MSKEFSAWAVYYRDDNGFQKGLHSVWTSPSDAFKAGIGLGPWGSRSEPEPVKAVTLEGRTFLLSGEVDLDCVKAKKDQSIRDAALAKLTDEEKILLGIK